MKTRPQVVTVIAWALFIGGVLLALGRLSIIGNPFLRESMEHARLPVFLQYLVTFAEYAVFVMSGIFMLNGESRGRTLYMGWVLISFVLSIVNEGFRLSPFIVLFLHAIVIVLLLRPPAAEYFQTGDSRGILG
jgi:hypothetical protein